MKTFVNEAVLNQLVRDLAIKTRCEIDNKNISIDHFEEIAGVYNINFQWQALSYDKDGYYAKDARVITLNQSILHAERRNFSFCHELMHDRIDRNDELFEVFHEFTINMSDKEQELVIERLCNIGAAELLIPSTKLHQMIDEYEFSSGLIPELCRHFNASSLAVAFQMISTAKHSCYLIVAEISQAHESNQPQLFNMVGKSWVLRVIYSGKSPSAKYTMGRNYSIQQGHVMYHALDSDGPISAIDDIPRRNSDNHRWEVHCDCLAYKGWVFGFFHENQPISPDQLKLF